MLKKLLVIGLSMVLSASLIAGTFSEHSVKEPSVDVKGGTHPSGITQNLECPFPQVRAVDLSEHSGAIVGVEVIDTLMWVTAFSVPSGSDNYVFIVNLSTGEVVDSFMQPTTSTYGWRDMAYDGQYVYASDGDSISVVDVNTYQVVNTIFPGDGDLSVYRALAFDGDSLITTNWSSGDLIWKFATDGSGAHAISTQGLGGEYGAYGLAWDADLHGLWLSGQNPYSSSIVWLPYDAATGMIDEAHIVSFPSQYESNVAGGCDLEGDYLYQVDQSEDVVRVYRVHPATIDLGIPMVEGLPSVVPFEPIDITIYVKNYGLTATSATDVTLEIYDSGGTMVYQTVLPVAALDPQAVDTIVTTWTPDHIGDYSALIYVSYPGDGEPEDDTFSTSFSVVNIHAGGPDGFGYTFVDSDDPSGSVTFEWVDAATLGTLLSYVSSGDDYWETVALPFSFPYYDLLIDTLWVCGNGFLSTEFFYGSYSNDPLPSSKGPDIIAGFWDDLSPQDGNGVWYYEDPDGQFVVFQWDSVPHWGSGGPYTFEIILYADGNIKMQYKSIGERPDENTIGIQSNYGDNDYYLQYIYNGAPIVPHDSLAVMFYKPTVADYTSDFESDGGGFVSTDGWEWGTPTVGPDSTHSGVNLWGTVLDDNYADNAHYELISPLFVATQDSPSFTFYHWYSIESGWDGGNVQISTDGGTTWTVITPEDGYPDDYVSALGGPGYTGYSNEWTQATFHLDDITVGTNFYIKFNFQSDGSVNRPGWYIDDFVASGFGAVSLEVHDIAAVSIDSLPSSPIPGVPVPLFATFVNNGTTSESFDAFYEVYDSVGVLVYQTSITVSDLPVGEQVSVNFGTWTPDANIYTMVAYSALDGDRLPQNDTVQVQFATIGHTGGPDSSGYMFVDSYVPDGPEFDWIEPTDSVYLTSKVSVSEKKSDPFEIKGGAVKGWDDGYFAIPLPFTFTFYDVPHDTVYASTNGYLSFSGNYYTSFSNQSIPNPNLPNDLIAVFWDDLRFYESDSARLDTVSGVTPDGIRYFVIEWDHVSRLGHAGDDMEFEAILFENGDIILQYKHIVPEATMTIGIENPDGTDGLQYIYNGSPIVPSDSLAIRFYQTELPDFFTDFEADNGGFTSTDGWEWGTPTVVGPDAAYSGMNLWGTVLDDNYADNAHYELISPLFVATQDSPSFTFYHWYSIESGWDGGNVQISTDGGTTWTVITPEGGYPDDYVSALDAPGYTGSSDGWIEATFHLDDITVGTNFYIKFNFQSDGSVNRPGWYIDDFAAYGFAPVAIEHDIEAVSVDVPPMAAAGVDIELLASFANVGVHTETFDVAFDVYNSQGDLVHHAVSSVTALEPGETTTVDFGSWTPDEDVYTLVTYSMLANDQVPGNDTATSTLITIGHAGGPDAFGYVFEDSYAPGGPEFNWIEATDSVWLTAKSNVAKAAKKAASVIEKGTKGGEKSWDDGHFAIPLPFSFTFYGNTYDTVYASTNGYLSFTGNNYDDYSNDQIPYQWSPNDLIAVFWDDLKFREGSHLDTISGVTPDGVHYFVIEYDSVSFYSYSDQYITFEAVLYEDGSIVLQYLDLGTIDASHGASATVGIENQDGTVGLQYIYNGEPFLLIDGLAVKFYRPIDAAVTSILEPTDSAYQLNEEVPLNVLVSGTEGNELTVEAKVTLSDSVIVFDSTVSFVASGNDTAINFGSIIPSFSGVYNVLFVAYMEGDIDPTNDSLSTSFAVYDFSYPDNLPVFEPTTAGWQFGSPEGGAYSGENAWATGLTTNYSPNADWILQTPVYMLYGEHPVFVFHHRFNFSDEDGGVVEISTDSGATWTKIEPVLGGYTGTSSLFGGDAFVGSSDWMATVIDLSDYAGKDNYVMLRFHFKSNDTGEDFGWVIDDYGVTGGGFELPNDAKVLSASILPGSVLAGATQYHLTAQVANSASGQAGNFRVVVKIFGPDGMLYYRSQKTLYLEPDEIATVYFQPDFVPMMAGNYRLELTVATSFSDPVLENNTYTADFTVSITKALAESDIRIGVPLKFAVKLLPNPAVSSANIELALPRESKVVVKIYDASGRAVRTLLDGVSLEAGYHTFTWDRTDDVGHRVSSGVYFVKVRTDSGDNITSRLVIIK